MKYLATGFLLLLSGCASTQDAGLNKSLTQMMMGEAPRSELTAVEKAEAEKHPLGSVQNPVLAQGPAGEQAYFARLRCPEGKQPFFERGGSVMERSPYGSIMDVYEVVCDKPPASSLITMGMAIARQTSAANLFRRSVTAAHARQ